MAELELQKWLETIGFSAIDEVSDEMNTPIHKAFEQGKLDFAKMMHARGCSLHVKDSKDSLPTLLAAENGHLELLKWAKDNGVDILSDINEHGDSSITMATFGGHVHVMEYLYECGVDIERRSTNGFTLVLIAAENGRLEALDWLVAHGCSLNQRDSRWNTPMILATFAEHEKVVRYLMSKGADFKSGDDCQLTPLMLAADRGSVEMVQLFLEHGANIFEKDKDGETVGEKLARSGSLPALKIGLSYGISVTPKLLVSAIKSGNVEMVNLLKEKTHLEPTVELVQAVVLEGHVDMLNYLLSESDVDWKSLLKQEADLPFETDDVWEWAFFNAIGNGKLELASHIKEKCGIKLDERYLAIFKWINTKTMTLSLDWMVQNGMDASMVLDHLETSSPLVILSGGSEFIKWIIKQGWKGTKLEHKLLNATYWPPDLLPGQVFGSIRILIDHFNWDFADLEVLRENMDDDDNLPLSAVLFAILDGDLGFLKYLIEKKKCRILPQQYDPIEFKCQLLQTALRGGSVGVLKYLLQALNLKCLPNVFKFAPHRAILMSPTLGFRKEDWKKVMEMSGGDMKTKELLGTASRGKNDMNDGGVDGGRVKGIEGEEEGGDIDEDDEGDQFGGMEVDEDDEDEGDEQDEEEDDPNRIHTFLTDIFIAGNQEIFEWSMKQCSRFGLSESEGDLVLGAIFQKDSVQHLSWLVENEMSCWRVLSRRKEREPLVSSATMVMAFSMEAFECVEWLFSHGASFTELDHLYGSACRGDTPIPKLQYLFRNGFLDPRQLSTGGYLGSKSRSGIHNILQYPIIFDHLPSFLFLLRHGASLEDHEPLIELAKHRSPDIYAWFFQHGFYDP